MRARIYDLLSQQFLSRDPLEAASGQPYVYAGGDLVNYADPTGNFRWRASMFMGSDPVPGGPDELPGTGGKVPGGSGRLAPSPGGAQAQDAAGKATTKTGKVYRGLAQGEDPSQGLWARAPRARNTPEQHIQGQRRSQWIATTKSLTTALRKYGKHGAVEIDLSKVTSEIVDASKVT
jgi:hypothetical protein